MGVEIRVPALGESISEATIGRWFKKEGDAVQQDEPVVELETEKVTVEVPAPAGGVLSKIIVKEGDTIKVGGLLGSISAGDVAKLKTEKTAPPITPKEPSPPAKAANSNKGDHGPAVARIVAESGKPVPTKGSGKDGRVTKGDMIGAVSAGVELAKSVPAVKPARAPSGADDSAREERVRMTKLRQTIAHRLKEAQNTAAILTTFNEVDMGPVMELRKQYKDAFEKKHGVKLGFMGFFVKAVVQALKDIPAVNAEIDGTDLVYKNYYHIGMAVGTDKGLVVPVLRDADQLSLPEIEQEITAFAARAREGTLKIEDLQGGTFTISNGGVYGSLLSTPILNTPQSGILGLHKIQERAVVIDGKVVARPMMYLALSYDHRVIDGKEAVTFLVRVKEELEDPARLVLDL